MLHLIYYFHYVIQSYIAKWVNIINIICIYRTMKEVGICLFLEFNNLSPRVVFLIQIQTKQLYNFDVRDNLLRLLIYASVLFDRKLFFY